MRRVHILGFASLVFSACNGFATTIVINFDSFTPGAKASDFLAPYGIPSVTPGGAAGAGGLFVADHTITNSLIPSSPNVLEQTWSALDRSQPHHLDFSFSPQLTSFGLTRVGKHSMGSTEKWVARFYDEDGGLLGSFGEDLLMVNQQPKPFTFDAPPGAAIARMELESVYLVSTHRNIPVDDFILVQIPEPAHLLLFSLFALVLRRTRCGRF